MTGAYPTTESMPTKSRPTSRSTTDGQLRIIGGQWRGRKLRFPAVDGLRPTPDRVRETLFNWLAPELEGARCLDLFAGSGALGLEALSRGAGHCRFVELARPATQALTDNLALLGCTQGTVVQADALAWLASQTADLANIVFVDPPFRRGLAAQCCTALARPGLLAPGSWLYLETGTEEPLPDLPAHWELYRDKRAGQVSYRLIRV